MAIAVWYCGVGASSTKPIKCEMVAQDTGLHFLAFGVV
ncbi:hypothetical protein APHCR_0058 [Anaplasma phagocytophilum str. CR1007]|uniref:Uncharacterized protein n=1 Tax=Anaplasma phagocytophilum (strain HZ) TaxID=212042 RepID=Q2GKF3_ANAPZ|nr:hypothetical protein APH_0556 [Anaplasma phagocytophilum str. HZ]KJV98970.1 hypothetical protein OTSANNIE_0797 [Anaplasma phagocytophilum str. Annie]KJZ98198.1 hypothetical protein APHDU1_1347 [Anaplasma phagocytophilum]KJZ99510.1 hypothetical protein APHCR_0058 [Anaplasma phagocytophilum str. CR1007]